MALIMISMILLLIENVLSLDYQHCTNTTGPIFGKPIENPEMRFYLYTNKNFYDEQEIMLWNTTSLFESNFNQSHPTRILVHGYKNSKESCFNGYVKDAYLKRDNFNVIVVDWGDWTHHDYVTVAKCVFQFLGLNLANFTKFLHNDGKVLYDDMYLIGHSLGAQMSGAAGQIIKPEQYNTIFALDPAGPYFITADIENSLDSSDAKYVEQISTNMGEFGYSGIIGHSAFYPNYGRFQKYCLTHDAKRLACSHASSYWYFAESLNKNTEFCGQPCPYYWKIIFFLPCPQIKCNYEEKFLMGGEPSVPKIGTYYISVNYDPPFATCNCE